MKLFRWVVRRRLKYILLTSIFVFTLVLSIVLGSSLPIYSQTATSNPCQKFIADNTKYASCEKLILDIHETAKRHVQGGESMQTLVVKQLYENNSLKFTSPEIAQIYEEEYLRLKKENPFSQLPLSWLFTLAVLLGIAATKFLEKWLIKSWEIASTWLYRKLAGSPLLLRIALNRYRKSLVNRYQELKIAYRPNRPLNMEEVYVPLKVAGASSNEQIEAKQAIAEYPRLMVKGVPGSGKSMLLKHLALIYGKQERVNNLPVKSIPVLVDLYQLTDSALDQEKLEWHLVKVLERNDFPQAERFVSQSLKRGELLLLFDGLDEVNSNLRQQVVQAIKNLLRKYRKCPAMITCRTAVYNDEFNDLVNQTLEIEEFNDRQIRHFLTSWSSQMPPEKSIEQLLKTLQGKPRIMSLARNPLLLTIIAYLYCDTAFVLPDSRSEFYRKSTDVLLELRDEERNIASLYRANEKRRVLQKLALYAQDSRIQGRQYQRDIDYRTVLAQVNEMLVALNLNPEQDTKKILQEIVERSGLLIKIDSGDRYQFALLSIQEFFAAEALKDSWRDLIVRYVDDSNAWRETIKLWCGLAGNSTELIRAIYDEDALLAFECLADAQEVDQDLSANIIDQFKNQLGRSDDDNLAKAFGAVAASSRLRGRTVFSFLEETLANSDDQYRRSAAAHALALTNLPMSTNTLAKYYGKRPEVRDPLISMGDLAVPVLASLAREGFIEALDDLNEIGTPPAKKLLETSLFKVATEKRKEKFAIQNIKIDLLSPSGFFIQKEQGINLKISNISEESISFDFELDETPKYEIRHTKDSRIKKIRLEKQESETLMYQVIVRKVGVGELQIKVDSKIFRPAIEIYGVQNNPYFYGPPVRNTLNFFGRSSKLQVIWNNIFSGFHTMIIGEQRSGKTSLLYQIKDSLDKPYICIFISFSGILGDNISGLTWLLKQLYRQLKDMKYLEENEQSFTSLKYPTDFTVEFQNLVDKIKAQNHDYKIVLLIDEANSMNKLDGVDIFQEVLRETFVQLSDDVRVLMACYYDFFEECESTGSELHNIFNYQYLEPLQGKDLQKLIVNPAKRFGYHYEFSAIEKIKMISGGHPYYCQFLCSESWIRAAKANKKNITLNYVNLAERQVLSSDKERFRAGYWKKIQDDEILFLKCLIKQKNIPSNKRIIEKLKKKFIIKQQNNSYTITSTLFESWISQLINEDEGLN